MPARGGGIFRQRAAAQQVALDHRGMRIDPGRCPPAARRRRCRASRRSARRVPALRRCGCHAATGATSRALLRSIGAAMSQCLKREPGQARIARSGAIGEVEAIARSARHGCARRASGSAMARGRKAKQQVTQKCGADQRLAHPAECRDLARAGARDDFRFGIEQRRRVESGLRQFVRHVAEPPLDEADTAFMSTLSACFTSSSSIGTPSVIVWMPRRW